MMTAVVAVLACVVSLAGSAGAQDDTFVVSLILETCTVEGTAPTTSLGLTKAEANGPGRDCAAGYPAESASAITLDGEPPNAGSDIEFGWEGVTPGEHTLSTGSTTGGDDTLTLTVTDHVTLWATYFRIEQPEGIEETQAAVDEEGRQTATAGEDAEDAEPTATDETAAGDGEDADNADPDETADAVSLPNTGSGDSGMNTALVAGAVFVIAVLAFVALRLNRSTRR